MSTAERRAREKAQRRQDILDAARREFSRRGFHQPTVEDVAQQAEVSKGTIYLYFKSKEEILAHLLLEGLDSLLDQFQGVTEGEATVPPVSTLEALARTYLRFCQSQPMAFRLLMAFDRGRFEESISRELYQEVLGRSMKGLGLVAESIGNGVQMGCFSVDDVWQAAGSFWAALNGVLVLMAHPLRRQMLRSNTSEMYEATLQLILKGLTNSCEPEREEGE